MPLPNDWLPIESAPRDRTIIVGRAGTLPPWKRGEGYADRAYTKATKFDIFEFGGGGWNVKPYSEPTHWQPLPEPPDAAT